MPRFRIHKARGTCRVVIVEADQVEWSEQGALIFTTGGRVVMAYSPWAWKSFWEDPQTQ